MQNVKILQIWHKIKQNLSPTISQKREDNTRNVGRSRKGLAGQQENRESKKQTKTKNGDGDYEDAIKKRNFGWKATSCQTVVKGQSLIIFND